MTTSHLIEVPYPWQGELWKRLFHQFESDHLPHALLISGLQGVGKLQLGKALAQLLLCNQPVQSLACGQCKGCHLFNAQTHPDFQLIIPEVGKQIKIEEIRALQAVIHSAAQMSGRKVVLLGPAESLNLNAANALLKSLEEPPGATHLILFTHQNSGVLPTISSRCQLLTLPIPDRQITLDWLAKVAGDRAPELLTAARDLPVRALAMLDGDHLAEREAVRTALLQLSTGEVGPVATAASLKNHSLEQVCLQVIDLVETWLQQSVDSDKPLQQWQGEAVGFLSFRDKALALLRKARGGANPNVQLAMEDLFIDFSRMNNPR